MARFPRGANLLLGVLLLLFVAGLGILGTLQYRWIDQVSDAERQRMHANLDFAARRLAGELGEELTDLFAQYSRADRATTNPLVESLYSLERKDDGWTLQQLDLATGAATDVDWPPKLEPIRAAIERGVDERGRPRWPAPLFGSIPALFVVTQFERPMVFEAPPMPRMQPRVTIVVLSRVALTQSILPRLVQRHFSSSADDAYEVALVSGSNVLYRSSSAWPDGKHDPDAEAMVMMPFGGGPRDARRGPPPRTRGEPPPPREGDWKILVRRSNGGLEATVTAARRRNLALNVTILMILIATVMTLLALLRRADRLRAQQAEFVAAMSHELNTPIAAMRAAGENLKDGIIVEREKLSRYGETIVKESARLGDMVAQVLEFAGMQVRTSRRGRGPIDVASIVEDAVSQSRALALGTPIEIEMKIDAGLPHVSGDAASLTRAVQNLVANAIRHGGSGNWVGISARWDVRGDVEIEVEDRGEGIDTRDVAHLFEPFFRGRNSASVRGAGLGLAIVRQIAEDHGGSVRVERRKGGGSVFTIRIPVSE